MALRDDVILALRIGTQASAKLSSEIDRYVNTARADLIRTGVSNVIASSNHELVNDAIITFCQYKMGNKDEREDFKKSYDEQCDNIRRSSITVAIDNQTNNAEIGGED